MREILLNIIKPIVVKQARGTVFCTKKKMWLSKRKCVDLLDVNIMSDDDCVFFDIFDPLIRRSIFSFLPLFQLCILMETFCKSTRAVQSGAFEDLKQELKQRKICEIKTENFLSCVMDRIVMQHLISFTEIETFSVHFNFEYRDDLLDQLIFEQVENFKHLKKIVLLDFNLVNRVVRIKNFFVCEIVLKNCKNVVGLNLNAPNCTILDVDNANVLYLNTIGTSMLAGLKNLRYLRFNSIFVHFAILNSLRRNSLEVIKFENCLIDSGVQRSLSDPIKFSSTDLRELEIVYDREWGVNNNWEFITYVYPRMHQFTKLKKLRIPLHLFSKTIDGPRPNEFITMNIHELPVIEEIHLDVYSDNLNLDMNWVESSLLKVRKEARIFIHLNNNNVSFFKRSYIASENVIFIK